MKKLITIVPFFLSTLIIGANCSNAVAGETYHYYTQNLSGHAVSAEQVGSMPVYQTDVGITSSSSYGTVKANVPRRNVYVNAIGNKKFTDKYPDGAALKCARYKYVYDIQLPVVPSKTGGAQTPQACHLMMQYWDGRNATWPANKNTLEAAIYWDLNPWDAKFGHLMIYTTGVSLYDTGVVLTPDTSWHTVGLIANFGTQMYEQMYVDGAYYNIGSVPLLKRYHPDWGSDLSMVITTESMNCYSSNGTIYWWDTNFRNAYITELY